MDWWFILAEVVGFIIGGIFGFAFGWFIYERFRSGTVKDHVKELREIEARLTSINERMLAKDPTLTPVDVAEYISRERQPAEKPKRGFVVSPREQDPNF